MSWRRLHDREPGVLIYAIEEQHGTSCQFHCQTEKQFPSLLIEVV
jgi:hypothetical protein